MKYQAINPIIRKEPMNLKKVKLYPYVKEGDTFKITSDHCDLVGERVTVIDIDGDEVTFETRDGDECMATRVSHIFNDMSEFENIKRKNNIKYHASFSYETDDDERKPMLQTLTNFLKRQLDAKTQKLFRAGLINGDLELTSRGRQELETLNYFTNKEELVKVAEDIIAEAEKDED